MGIVSVGLELRLPTARRSFTTTASGLDRAIPRLDLHQRLSKRENALPIQLRTDRSPLEANLPAGSVTDMPRCSRGRQAMETENTNM